MRRKPPRGRKRRRRSLPAIEWLTLEQQYAQALELVPTARPAGIRNLIELIQTEKEVASVELPLLKDYQDAAAALRAAELVLGRPSLRHDADEGLLWRLRQARENAEDAERAIKEAPRGHGGRQSGSAQITAALYAGVLLSLERGQRPALTAGEDWHKLAAILYGHPIVDLFGFHYLRRAHQQMNEDMPWTQFLDSNTFYAWAAYTSFTR
jgi:hypothetical protein